MLWFALFCLIGWILVVGAARLFRGRFYSIFVSIVLFVQAGSAMALFETFQAAWPAWAYLQAAVFAHFFALVWPRARPLPWRVLVSIPASFFAAGSILALPWAIAWALGFEPWGAVIPYVLAAVGVAQSLWTREEEVDVTLDGNVVEVGGVRRHPLGEPSGGRPLRIVQLTDTHIGPFMSPSRLARICRRAVERDPDLILLTGDFLTMESQADPTLLERALAPLKAAEGKTFACFGNHDHEAPEIVTAALASAGVRLLIDQEAVLHTASGPVQILGMDFSWRSRGERMAALCRRFPRRDHHLRVVLLHDPGAFQHLPEGHGDIVFSGHTHGGQVGLVSLGLKWTFLSGLTSLPDHGLWARGRDRLYVHRGTGHYGFPLRLGVPSEESLVNVYWASCVS